MKRILLGGLGGSVMKEIQLALEANLQDLHLELADTIPGVQGKLLSRKFDLLIFDLRLEAERMPGYLADILSVEDAPKTLAYCLSDDAMIVTYLYRLGLKGFIRGRPAEEELLLAAQTIFEGRIYLSPGMQTRLLDMDPEDAGNSRLSDLSETELRILVLLLREERVVDISSLLGLSPGTVSNIKKRILKKLAINSLSEAHAMVYGNIIR